MKKITAFLSVCICATFSFFCFFSCQKNENGHTRYEIIAEYIPENRTLTGALKVIFENGTNNELSQLKFQLHPNAYRQNALYKPISSSYTTSAYYAGESFGEIVISSVNGGKRWEVVGEDKNILCVSLERSLFPNEKVVLDIGFTTKLAQVNHRLGITKKVVNLGNFFPILCGIKHDGFWETVYYPDGDPFYSDCADYKMTLTLPKDYTVVSTGKILTQQTLERKKVYTMYATNVRDFALALSKHYRVTTTKSGDTTISYYYYADGEPLTTLAAIKESFAYYEKAFGEYPHETYAVAQTGFCVAGMEYPCLSLISDNLTKEERFRVIAHETAHQWWYSTVGSNQIENAWLDEGLAEYSTILFFENYEKYGYLREEMVRDALKEYRSYYDVYGSVLGRTDTAMNRHLKDFINAYEYKCLTYNKATVMFDALRKSVGDKKFMSALRRYYADNRFSMATPDALIGAFERVGLDVRGFFDGFIDGKVIL